MASAGLLVCGAEPLSPGDLADRETVAGLNNPPPEARTRLFWRIFGPSWTAEEIDYQLGLLKNAGVGGETAFFMYPVALEAGDVHTQGFLPDEFLSTLGRQLRPNIEEGHSLVGDGDYPVMVLPRIIGLELEDLRKLVAFCRSGGTVVITGRQPERDFGAPV